MGTCNYQRLIVERGSWQFRDIHLLAYNFKFLHNSRKPHMLMFLSQIWKSHDKSSLFTYIFCKQTHLINQKFLIIIISTLNIAISSGLQTLQWKQLIHVCSLEALLQKFATTIRAFPIKTFQFVSVRENTGKLPYYELN